MSAAFDGAAFDEGAFDTDGTPGSSGAPAEAGKRGKNWRTGLEPVAKDHRSREKPAEPALPIPPTRFLRRSPPIQPGRLIDPILLPDDPLGIEQAIFSAQDTSDILNFVRSLEQEEQDAADIADVLALLNDLEMA